jgi:hypothetical protein
MHFISDQYIPVFSITTFRKPDQKKASIRYTMRGGGRGREGRRGERGMRGERRRAKRLYFM